MGRLYWNNYMWCHQTMESLPMTKRYYLWCAATAPVLAALIAFSTLPMIVSVVGGLFVEAGLIMAGYNLGKRK